MHPSLNRIKYTLGSATMLASAYTTNALAQFAGESPDLGLAEEVDEGGLRQIIIDVISLVLNFLALIAVVVIIVAGIRLIVSQGNEDQRDKAKKTILYAVIGLIVVLFARVIVSLVTDVLSERVGGQS